MAAKTTFFLFGLLALNAVEAVQQYPKNRYLDNENAIAIKDMRNAIEDVRHELNNHESEIRAFDEKLSTIDSIIDAVRDQLGEANRFNKEQIKGNSQGLETKISALDGISKGLVADFKQFKNHANEMTTSLTQAMQKMGQLDKVLDQQAHDIEHLKAAMHSLIEAFNGNSTASANAIAKGELNGNAYKVKSGDNLENIALRNHTTVKEIKELNGLISDKIVVGKVLQLPQKK